MLGPAGENKHINFLHFGEYFALGRGHTGFYKEGDNMFSLFSQLLRFSGNLQKLMKCSDIPLVWFERSVQKYLYIKTINLFDFYVIVGGRKVQGLYHELNS